MTWSVLARGLSLLALASCGDDGVHALPDAPSVDGSSATDAPPGGTVTVTVWRGGGVRDPDAIVLFQSASGALVTRLTTDANGVAAAEVPTGGMVTVLHRDGLTTIAQVAGGDELTVGDDRPVASTGTATLALPAAPSGTTQILVHTTCSAGVSSTAVVPTTINASCAQPQTVVAAARAGAVEHAYLVATDVALAAATTTTLGGTWAAPAQFAWTVQNLPATVTSGAVAASSRIGTQTLSLAYVELSSLTSATIPMPPAFGDGTETQYFLRSDSGAYQQVSESVAGPLVAKTIDGTALLPWIESLAGDATDVAWTQSAGADYDGAIATIDFNYKNTPLATWRVILPPSARQFSLPPLPADLEIPTQAQEIEVHVQLIESSTFDVAGMRAYGGAASFLTERAMPAVRRVRISNR